MKNLARAFDPISSIIWLEDHARRQLAQQGPIVTRLIRSAALADELYDADELERS